MSLESPNPVHPRWAVVDVLALNFATGIVEAVSYTHLGGLFSAFVTGTIILAGVHLGTGGLASLAPYGVAFVAFIVGAFLGGRLVHGQRSKMTIYIRALVVEVLILAVAAVVALIPVQPGESAGKLATLGLLALGMAVQFSATRYLNVPFLAFAAATGQVHGIANDLLAHLRVPKLLSRRLLSLVTLVIGALVGALVALWSVSASIGIATIIVLAAVVLAWAAPRRSTD